MTREVRLQIDERPVLAHEGTSLIEVARQMRIEIPCLCYNQRLEPQGGCRMCSVEVDDGSGRHLVVACGYPARDGLKVWTRSPEIDRVRRMLVELAAPLVARGGCVTGKLGRIAATYQARPEKFVPRSVKDPSGCTLCGLCVGTCCEVVAADAIGFVGRGVERHVVRFAAGGCDYPTCKQCLAVCFTGKIAMEADATVFPQASIDDFLERRGVKIHSIRSLRASTYGENS